MTETNTTRQYDLEERTFEFARNVRKFLKAVPRTVGNFEDGKQVIRSSGSIGANYIEANESLGKKDFVMRIRISLKEAKETRYWLRLLDAGNEENENIRNELIQEATELMKIMNAIVMKSK